MWRSILLFFLCFASVSAQTCQMRLAEGADVLEVQVQEQVLALTPEQLPS